MPSRSLQTRRPTSASCVLLLAAPPSAVPASTSTSPSPPLPAPPGPFDVIVIGDVLEHLRRPQDLLEQLRQHLAPGGQIVASLPNSGNIYFRLQILLGNFPEDEKGLFDRTHLHFWMLANWRGLFERSGYSFEIAEVPGIPVGLAIPSLGWLDVLCSHLARGCTTLFAYQYLSVAKLKSS